MKSEKRTAAAGAVAEWEELGKGSFGIVEITSGKWCDVGCVDEN